MDNKFDSCLSRVMCACVACLCFGTTVGAEMASDEVFGARDDAMGPLGGGTGYRRFVTKYDYLVKTEQQLIDTLNKAKAGQVIYVDDKAELDFTPWIFAEELAMVIPGGVTLASGRGKEGSKGALLMSAAFKTYPLFSTGGPNVRVTGLRIQGPDMKVRYEPLERWCREDAKTGKHTKRYNKFPVSVGIRALHPHTEVDNCELSGWGVGAVRVGSGGWDKGATDAHIHVHIHHNHIHHNQRAALGYGVSIWLGTALIESNIFDWNRHSIAATGRPGESYEARNNLVGEHATSHMFDMHGGRDRKDGTHIAGDWIKVHHNTFKAAHQEALKVRGIPREKVEVHHNWFLHPDIKSAILPYTADWLRISRNQFGPERKLIE